MDVDQEIIAPDFADQLPPGYRFCPTDSELIVYYLNAKIDSRQLPECRLHEFNIYNHKPEELAERYRSSENNWYFLTPRDRKYAKGNRPDRVVGNFGFWKTTQKQKPVRDHATRQVVGYKGTLTFFNMNKEKTMWLMHEYTTNGPNLPFGSGKNNKKLNEWVLCKIYKNEKTESGKGEGEYGNTMIQEEVHEERDGNPERSWRKRPRVSENHENNFSNHHEHVEVEEANGELGNHAQILAQLTAPMGSGQTGVGYKNGSTMKTSPSPIPMQPRATFQGSNSIQPAPYCYQYPQKQYFDQIMSYQDPQSQLLYTPNGSDQYTVMPHDASNDIPQPGGYGAPSSPLDTDTWSLEDLGMRHDDIPQPADGDNASTSPLRIDDLETVPIESLLEIFF